MSKTIIKDSTTTKKTKTDLSGDINSLLDVEPRDLHEADYFNHLALGALYESLKDRGYASDELSMVDKMHAPHHPDDLKDANRLLLRTIIKIRSALM